jgi:hypothetical protein
MSKNINKSYVENKECLACTSTNLRTVLDLGLQPLANEYHKGEDLPEYPLSLNLCQKCFHLQLSCSVNPDLMFKNYLYVSGTTETLRKYFDDFAEETLRYNPEAKSILDIACNDGTQLDSYKKLGLSTFGIDPAENLLPESTKNGHEIVCDYFNSKTISKFEGKRFDLITAQNVFAHTRFTEDFLKSCNAVMHDDSFLFIQTSQSNMVVNNEFDTIYHEHISFFNSNSMKTLVERCGLFLSNIFKTDVHGTSYVFVITKKDKGQLKGVSQNMKSERKNGLFDILTYPKYSLKCYKATFKLKNKLEKLKKSGYMIVGYGAAAKGNTLLNFGNIELDFIVDDNPLKQGLLTPGRNIRIESPKVLVDLDPKIKVAFVPLAWNFYPEIKRRIQSIRNSKGDIFITYFPKLIIE